MRLLAAAIALALAAVPAAAQPEPDEVIWGVLEQASRNVPAEVRDYVATIATGPIRVQLYVFRDEDGWGVAGRDDAPLGDLFAGMMIWPHMDEERRAGGGDIPPSMRGARYMGRDSVEGQDAFVLRANVPGLTLETMDIPDSAYVYVDARTRQVLRVRASVDVEPTGGGAMAAGGHMDMDLVFSDYQAFNGVTLPRRMRMETRTEHRLDQEELTAMREELQGMLSDVGTDTSPEAQQTRLLVEMFVQVLSGEPLAISAVVEDVQVNTGRPAWADQDY